MTLNGGTLTEPAVNALTGSQALAVSGGTANLSLANNFTGNTTVSAGRLTLGDPLAIQNSTLDTGSGTGTVGSARSPPPRWAGYRAPAAWPCRMPRTRP